MVPMMGNAPSLSPAIFGNDENIGIAYGMGLTAEKVAQQWKISREAQDAFSVASHQKAMAATAAGYFKDEIAPVTINERTPNLATGEITAKSRVADTDEGPRADTSMEGLAKLRTVFATPKTPSGEATGMGSVTAGNSSQTSDGAGAVLIVSEKALKQYNLTPMARFVSFSIKGVDPKIMGIGPKEAIPLALKYAGLKQDDLGWIELNEAFAAQALAVIGDLGLNPDVVNPNGGAIALGHPLGATGAMRAATCLYGMRRTKAKYGMVTMCVGTGMGAAGIFEAV